MSKMRYFIGMDEEEDSEEETYETMEEKNGTQASRGNNVYKLYDDSAKIELYKPKDFTSASRIVDALKFDKSVVMNLEEIDPDISKKFFDFVSGSIYALEGTIKKASDSTFVIVPRSVELTDINEKDYLKNKKAYPWQK